MMAPIKISLGKIELEKIKILTKKGLEDVRVVKRALILKSRHMGIPTEDIVGLLDVDSKTVSNTLNNFLEFGFDTQTVPHAQG
ncbi:MAG: helix-turn-helix domain-containing protein [Bdellovibrio sp.]|nr:helix-turn-helix domain-containing protein [Bdellovibrio sp.]